MDDDSQSNMAYEIVVALLYSVAIGVNVYLIVNQLTDGALATSLSMRLIRLRARLATAYENEQTARRDAPKVVFEAMTIVEDAK